jgi:methylphosphotriester-DNA--protein-cysteine methyltransferase
LSERDTSTFPQGAVLHPQNMATRVQLRRYAPCAELADVVRHFWFVTWDYAGLPGHSQETLPLPSANAVIEADGAYVYGPQTKRGAQWLEGKGHAFGALFLAGAFSAFYRDSMAGLRDRRVSFASTFGETLSMSQFTALRNESSNQSPSETTDSALREQASDTACRRLYEAFLTSRRVAAPVKDVVTWVNHIEKNSQLTRAEELASHFGVQLRTLQRQFRRHVGLSPKLVIRRYRLLDAAARLTSDTTVNHCQLALSLGYSHFVRDFCAAIGVSPARYAAQVHTRSLVKESALAKA